MILISHDLNLVKRYSDEIIVMRQGQTIEQGKTALCLGADQSHDGRSDGQFRFLGRRYLGGTESYARFRRTASNQGDHAAGIARRFSDSRVPAGARIDRSNRATTRTA